MGRWKLLYDVLGHGELYDLERDPAELDNRFDDPSLVAVRLALVEELLAWTIRTEDDLPGGAYVPKRAERNWYAPYRGEPNGHRSETSALERLVSARGVTSS